jgi:hypothetical protein
MTVAKFQASGISALRDAFANIGASLPDLVLPWSQRIAAGLQSAIDDRYPKMGDYFGTFINHLNEPGEISDVTAESDDPIVIWYTYGTKPHEMPAGGGKYNHNMVFELHEGSGDFIFTPHVNHPGARAHDAHLIVMAELIETAAVEWTEALENALLYLTYATP